MKRYRLCWIPRVFSKSARHFGKLSAGSEPVEGRRTKAAPLRLWFDKSDFVEMPTLSNHMGRSDVWTAAALIFFAYLGFDELGNLAKEVGRGAPFIGST